MNILGLSSRYNDIVADGNERLSDEPLKIGTKTNNDLSFIVNNQEQLKLTSSGATVTIDEIKGSQGVIEICDDIEPCDIIEGEWLAVNPSAIPTVDADGKPVLTYSAPISGVVPLDMPISSAEPLNISFRLEKLVSGADSVGIGFYGGAPPLAFTSPSSMYIDYFGIRSNLPFTSQSNTGNASGLLKPTKLQPITGAWTFFDAGVYRIRLAIQDGKASWYVKAVGENTIEYRVSTCDLLPATYGANWQCYTYNGVTGSIIANTHVKSTGDIRVAGWPINETFSHLNELANNEAVEQLPKVLKVVDQDTNDWKLNRKEYEYSLPERSGRLITVDDVDVNDINTEVLTLEVAENTTRISQNESDIKDLEADVIANSNDITSINLALNDKVNKGGEDTGSLIIGTTASNVNDVEIIQNGNPGITIDGVNITTSKNLRNAVNGDYAFQSSITSLENSKVSRGGEPIGSGILTLGTGDASQVQVVQNGAPALTIDSSTITTDRTLTNLANGDYAFDSDVKTNATNIATNSVEIKANDAELLTYSTDILNNTLDIINNTTDIVNNFIELKNDYSSLTSNMVAINFNQSQLVSGGITYNAASTLISANNTQTKSIWTSTAIISGLETTNYIVEFELSGANLGSDTIVALRSDVDDASKSLWITSPTVLASFPDISGVQVSMASSSSVLYHIIMDHGKVLTASDLQNKGNEIRYIRFVIVSGVLYVLGKTTDGEWFNWSLDPGIILGAGSPTQLLPGYRIDTGKSYYVGVFDNTTTASAIAVKPRIYSLNNQFIFNIDSRLNGFYVEDLRQNPAELTGATASYPVQWSNVYSADLTINNTTGVVSKPTANTQVSWAYSKNNMLEPHKYNYRVKVSLYSITAFQFYVHFCTKNIPATDRTGTTYPAESGTTGSYPLPPFTNIWGKNASFMLGSDFRQYLSESQIINFPNTNDWINTTSATQAVPWEFTFVMHDGKITSILTEHGTDPVFDALPRFGVSEFDLPQESLFVGLSDLNNFTPSSSFEIGVTIESKSVRHDPAYPYTLQNLTTSPDAFINETLSSAAERFISARAITARLYSYVSSGDNANIVNDTYYLPYPSKIGQRVVLFNESTNTLTIYYPDNSSSVTLQGNINRDHAEFIAVDLTTWHQLA